MKKKSLSLVVLGTILLVGCGTSAASNNTIATENEIIEGADSSESESEDTTENEEQSIETSDEAYEEQSTETSDEVSEEQSTETSDETFEEQDEFTYTDMSNLEFWYGSGVGAWCTTLQINEDGSFEGEYHDSDADTVYLCNFKGQFGELEQVNEYTYSTTIETIEFENEPGEQEQNGDILIIYSEPYGLDDAKRILFYLQGAPVNELPEEFLSWISYGDYDWNTITELPFVGLYNKNAQAGFSSYEAMDLTLEEENASDSEGKLVNEELAIVEEQAKQLEDQLQQDITQMELNQTSKELYDLWDDELNSVWSQLKETLSEDEMKTLIEEEREWISYKEEEIENAGSEYEGGSIQPLIENLKGAELTKEQVYELVELLNK